MKKRSQKVQDPKKRKVLKKLAYTAPKLIVLSQFVKPQKVKSESVIPPPPFDP